jgi:hypothetical protein
MDVVVEPGVGWMELNEYLKPHGLFFPLDPGKLLVPFSPQIYFVILPFQSSILNPD